MENRPQGLIQRQQGKTRLVPLSGRPPEAEDRPESSKNLVSILMVKAGIALSQAVVHGHTTAALLLWGRVLHMHLQVTVPRCSQSCACLPHFAHFQKVQFKCQI